MSFPPAPDLQHRFLLLALSPFRALTDVHFTLHLFTEEVARGTRSSSSTQEGVYS